MGKIKKRRIKVKPFIHSNREIQFDIIQGLTKANKEKLQWTQGTGIVLRKDLPKKGVTLLSGGGSGHEPAHIGYIGENMLTAAVMGPFFLPPTSDEILKGIQQIDNGDGVLLIIKNFEKDLASFLDAEQKAIDLGHKVKHVIVNDDCSIEAETFKKRRRGVAGTVLVHKILGAAANQKYNLDDLEKLGKEVIYNLNTLGIAFSPSSQLTEDSPKYTLKENEMYYGIGIHGEPGYRIEEMKSSERMAIELVNKLISQFQKKDRLKSCGVLVNGLGSTPLLELSLFFNDVEQLLEIADVPILYKKVGSFLTSYDTEGISLTLLNIIDEQWVKFLEEPTDAFAW